MNQVFRFFLEISIFIPVASKINSDKKELLGIITVIFTIIVTRFRTILKIIGTLDWKRDVEKWKTFCPSSRFSQLYSENCILNIGMDTAP